MNHIYEITSKLKPINESEISSRIRLKEDGLIEYDKTGYHKPQVTDKPLSSVRLELAIDASGLTQGEITQLVNSHVDKDSQIAQPTISRIISGKVKKTTYFPVLAKTLGVSASWLAGLDQCDEMSIKSKENEISINGQRFILVCIYDKTHSTDTSNHNNRNGRESKIMVAAALIDDTIDISKLKFIYEDDRANAPEILPGASVTFDTSNTTIINGDFYVIQHGENKECVRTLFKEPNGDTRIRAKQSEFPEYIVKKGDQDLKILGRVVAVTNKF